MREQKKDQQQWQKQKFSCYDLVQFAEGFEWDELVQKEKEL